MPEESISPEESTEGGSAEARPEHDPLSEEMDLITFQEADARLWEEMAWAKKDLEALQATDTASARADAVLVQRRIEALAAVTSRLRNQRTQPKK